MVDWERGQWGHLGMNSTVKLHDWSRSEESLEVRSRSEESLKSFLRRVSRQLPWKTNYCSDLLVTDSYKDGGECGDTRPDDAQTARWDIWTCQLSGAEVLLNGLLDQQVCICWPILDSWWPTKWPFRAQQISTVQNSWWKWCPWWSKGGPIISWCFIASVYNVLIHMLLCV